LTTWINNLDEKYFICADNAYPLSNKVLVPFRGAQAATMYNSSYNFYLSQLRIRVELAFGRLTTKFRRLRTKMSCRLSMQSKVIQAATRLHNYIIDNDKPEFGTIRLNADGTIDREELDRFGVEPLTVGNEHEGDGDVHGNFGFIGYNGLEYDDNDGTSARRTAIVDELLARDIRRPIGRL
jgi:hypothetical protein